MQAKGEIRTDPNPIVVHELLKSVGSHPKMSTSPFGIGPLQHTQKNRAPGLPEARLLLHLSELASRS
jgi:hypothetical protein